MGDRVAYLCPTKQLARQTAKKLTEYGIPNVLLINRVADWNPLDRGRYSAGDAIAVSVYSHVFNTNPALGNAQLLLLDDAHAAESYVASPWSLEISRTDEESAYLDVLSLIADALHPLIYAQMATTSPEGRFRQDVYLASPIAVAEVAVALEAALSTASATQRISKDARYALRLLLGHLDQCLIYVSYGRLLIRPLIAPTMSHPAFDGPARRVYMSATLGAGGELERTFGRRRISRIPIPKGWEKQGTGRRLFSFPELTLEMSEKPKLLKSWVAGVIGGFDRSLVLAPDKSTADEFANGWLPDGTTVLRAGDVEDDLTVFTASRSTALVLNNRYDGIDLPDDACRLVVLAGLPARGDLQERFLYGTLGAMEVLQERIRARIVQGAGRATRNSRDFATVLVLGADLISYVIRKDVQAAMQPEVHAELEFGYQQSSGISANEMLEQIGVFNEHGEAWHEVDADIVAARQSYSRVDPAGAAELQSSVGDEVAAYEAIWQGEWIRALESTRRVIDSLRGGRAPQRYAALWNYLASWIAQKLAQQSQDDTYLSTATAFDNAARAAGRGTLWLAYLAHPKVLNTPKTLDGLDPLDEQAMIGIRQTSVALGRPSKFEEIIQTTKLGLSQTSSAAYERAIVELGRFAGASEVSGDGGNDSAPDALWVFSDVLWIGWEAKSEALPDGELGSGDTRQAGGHIRFASATRDERAPDDSPVMLMTPQIRVHPSANAVAEPHVYLLRPTEVSALFDNLVRAWRTARARGISDLGTADIASIFAAEGALPTQWLPSLIANPLRIESNV
jgi:hypothetical protein